MLLTQSPLRRRWTTVFLILVFFTVSSCRFALVRAQGGPGSGSGSGSGSSPGGPGSTGTKISADLLDEATDPNLATQTVNVILQLNGSSNSSIDQTISQNNGTSNGGFQNLNARAVQIPAGALTQLSANSGVTYISSDREVDASGHLSSTTGADAVRKLLSSSGPGPSSGPGSSASQGGSTVAPASLDGSGIGVAVLDSGIDPNHRSFLGLTGSSRIVYAQDFTSDKRIDDLYGHGSHVASTLAGNDP